MKFELLSPAGDLESLKAAINGGCDAIYIGGKLFGARAFSNNFSNEEIVEAIDYCHLYGVKLYVTVNTLIYENEVEKFLNYVEFLYKNGVDALIIQDLGMMDLVRKIYPLLELHASTQMHVHNLEGVKFLKEYGIKRVVLARETKIEDVKKIKKNCNVDLEVFVHGSLCLSYSGQCLMSSFIGHRSGNRGTCAGTCRMKYHKDEEGYLLSCKDLCTLDRIGELIDIGVNSFKIEGRMKSPGYVYFVTKLYRQAIDSYLETGIVKYDKNDLNNLKKIFNREYTEGFLFNKKEIVNKFRPNHLGIEIGKIIDNKNNEIKIKLTGELNINDGIRIIDKEDKGFIVTKMFVKGNSVKQAFKNDIVTFKNLNSNLNCSVVKTSDYKLNKEVELLLLKQKKIPIIIEVIAKRDNLLKVSFSDGINKVELEKDIISDAISAPTCKETILLQIKKLGNTAFVCDDIKYDIDENIFVSIKLLNELRRELVSLLVEKRISKKEIIKKNYFISLPNFNLEKNYNIYIKSLEQYELIKNLNFKKIYADKFIVNDNRIVLKNKRVVSDYMDKKGLVCEVGGLAQGVDTDFSLNVTNSYTIAFLHSIGVNKITLSLELTDSQIKNIIAEYKNRYNKHPNLEVIVYGYKEAMVSKYIIQEDFLYDRFKNKYKIKVDDNIMTLYHYEILKLNPLKYFSLGINNVRLNILDELNFLEGYEVK